MIKKVLLSCSVLFIGLLMFVPTAHGIDLLNKSCQGASAQSSSFCKNVTQQAGEDRIVGPNGIITRVTQVLIFVTGAISLIMVIIGGARYVFSAGDPNGTKQAKDTILYALIGLAIAIFSQVIVSFVLSKL